MDADRWKRVREIFDAAADKVPDERAAFLDDACGDDAELRAEVESLLTHAAQTHGIDRVLGEAMTSRAAADDPTRAGTDIGPYRVLERLGAGGMGTVWLAERTDGTFRKKVALKVVRGGLDSPRMVERFRAEREILARLEHPGIARILDGGETPDGLPFVVLEHVDGQPIDAHCRNGNLSVRETLRLFRRVCGAVEYAHRQLVIHRDLKPANILVADNGDPKLLDFGIAKLVEDGGPGLTATGTRAMTPEYAAPEQIRGLPVSTATDVYALGLLLYEILTGRHPFRQESGTARDLESAVLDTEPVPPSAAARLVQSGRPQHARALAGDLDDIILMALEKDPARRYPTVAELSQDVGRHLDGLPVHARPATLGYRAGKFLRRNAVGVAVAGVVATLLIAATVISTRAYLRADRARAEAETQRATAEETNRFLRGMFAAASPVERQSKEELTAREVLDTAAASVGEELADRPAVAARLLQVIGGSYGDLGLWEEAESALRASLTSWEHAGESEGDDAVATLVQLGDALRQRGELEAAEEALRRAVALAPEIGPVVPGTGAEARRGLASVLEHQGRYDEAESTSVALIEELRAVQTDPDLVLWESLKDLALTHRQQGELVKAEERMREALEGFRAALGNEHSRVGRTLADLTFILNNLGRYEESVETAKESLAIKQKVFGEDHVQIAFTRVHLASALGNLKRAEESEAEFMRALEIFRVTYGENSREVAVTTNNVGLMFWTHAEDPERATPWLLKAVTLFEKVYGNEHPWTAAGRHNLASLYEDTERLEESEKLCRDVLALRRRILQEDHTDIARSEILLGRLLVGREAFTEAEPLLRNAVRICALNLPPEHGLRTGAELQLGRCLSALSQPEEAETLRSSSGRN